MRQKAQKKDLKQLEVVKYTKARRKESLMEIHKSAQMEHFASKNHTTDWEGVRLPAKEPDWKKRRVKEVIVIGKAGMHVINRDRGCHLLPEVFSKLLCHKI